MSKKSIVLEYQTPLEFIATYAQKGFEKGKEELEKLTGNTLLDLVAMAKDENEVLDLLNMIEDFTNKCNFLCCYDHEILHKYDNCPFCSLEIEIN